MLRVTVCLSIGFIPHKCVESTCNVLPAIPYFFIRTLLLVPSSPSLLIYHRLYHVFAVAGMLFLTLSGIVNLYRLIARPTKPYFCPFLTSLLKYNVSQSNRFCHCLVNFQFCISSCLTCCTSHMAYVNHDQYMSHPGLVHSIETRLYPVYFIVYYILRLSICNCNYY